MSFLIFLFHPGPVISHRESLDLVKIFLCMDSCSNRYFCERRSTGNFYTNILLMSLTPVFLYFFKLLHMTNIYTILMTCNSFYFSHGYSICLRTYDWEFLAWSVCFQNPSWGGFMTPQVLLMMMAVTHKNRSWHHGIFWAFVPFLSANISLANQGIYWVQNQGTGKNSPPMKLKRRERMDIFQR